MDKDEEAIRQLIAKWLAASSVGDTAQVLSLMADDVVFLVPGQPPMRGRDSFAAAQSALSDFRLEASSDIQEIKTLGDWAYCWTHLTVTVTPKAGGPSVKRAGHTLSVLQKQAGSWVIYRDANMLTVVTS
jgi:uncharacterized protein (TIGR02246 family)